MPTGYVLTTREVRRTVLFETNSFARSWLCDAGHPGFYYPQQISNKNKALLIRQYNCCVCPIPLSAIVSGASAWLDCPPLPPRIFFR